EQGLIVSRPYGESARYDFLVDWNGRLSRVQVKSVGVKDGNSYQIKPARGQSAKCAYSPSEVDFIAALVIPCDVWYIVPVAQIYPRKTVRVFPQRQSRRTFESFREAWRLLAEGRPQDALKVARHEMAGNGSEIVQESWRDG